MSTTALAPPVAPAGDTKAAAQKATPADHLIDHRIAEACRHLWWAEVVRSFLRVALVAMSGILAWLVVDHWLFSPGIWIRVAAWLFAVTLAGGYFWFRILPLLRSRVRPEYAARSLERDLPDLRQSLTSYVTLRDQPGSAGLRGRMVRSMGAATAGRLRSYDELPTEATGTLRWWIATAAGLAILVAYAVMSPKSSLQSATRLAAPLAQIDPPRRVSIREVSPGDAQAIAGRVVDVSAIIDGLRQTDQPVVRWTLPSERRESPLIWDEGDRRFHGEIGLPHSVSGEVPYVIAAGDAETDPFVLKVDDVPVVALESVSYQPPAYTGQKPHATRSGAIHGLDGTLVTIAAKTNRPVTGAKIEFNPKPLGDRVQATAGATEMAIDAEGTSLSVTFPLRSARGRSAAVELDSYRIHVWDDAGQSNPQPIVYPIRVISDLPPEVAITLPFNSPTEVAWDAQQIIEVHASDPDFGLTIIGLELRSGIDTLATPVLWEDASGGKGNQVVEFAFRPNRYPLRIGDEVQVVAVAVDNRSIENDPTVEPNTKRTDPVVLKIVPGDPSRTQDASDQDQPKRDDGSRGSDTGQQGEPQSGQGGGGGQSSGNQAQAKDPQNQGQGGSGQGQSGEQSDSAQNDSGSGGDGSSDGTQDSGQDQNSGQSQNQNSGQNAGANNAGAGDQPSGQPTGDSESQSGDPSAEPGPSSENQPGTAGDPSSQAQSGSGQPADSSQQTGNAETPENQSATGTNNNGGTRSPDAPGQSPNSNATGQPGQSGEQGGDQPSRQAPQHDGEAFERIRDYLENKNQREPQATSQKGESQRGESQRGESQSGESQSGESQSGESQSGESQSGESQSGESQGGESQGGESQRSGQRSGDATQPRQGSRPSTDETSASNQSSESEPSSGDLSGDRRREGASSASTPRGGAGDGSDVSSSGQSADSQPPVPPAAANLEYTKQATDMVLNYLEETRDAPDRELLDALQWDEQDLKRFTDRWQRIRELDRGAGAGTNNPDVDEALRSLGLRPPTETPGAIQESADALRGIRDSGNRKPPPAAFRDAFDAFRRSLSPES